jgi:hypothetical protein
LHLFCTTPDPYLQSHLLSRHTRLRPLRSYILLLRRSHQITSLQQSSQAYGGSAHTIFRFRPLLEAHEFLLDFGPLSALLDFGPLSALLDFSPLSTSFGFRPVVGPLGFWPVVGPLGFRPVVGPLGFRPVVGLFWISARCRPFLDFGPLLAPFGVWPIVGPFESAFSSYLQPLLATRQPLSSLAISTIYGPFPASATTVIIISDFKLKVAEYSTLSLRGDVRI